MNYLHNMITDGLAFGIPLFIMAVGAIYSEKSGVTNLAVEGFQGFGAFCGAVLATILALYAGLSTQTILYIALAMALVGGALYAILHALLCIQFKAEQVISGVVINILGISLTTFLTSQISGVLFGSASNKFTLGVSDRFTVPGLSSIPVLGAVFTNVYPFEVILLVISLFAWYLMYKTRFGMRLRACGDNPQAVDAAGGNVARTRFIAVMISGGFSGIGGVCFAYSLLSQFSPSIYLGYGYRDCGDDFRKLEYCPDFFCLPVFRDRPGGRVPALFIHGAVVAVYEPVHDDSVYFDAPAPAFLLEAEPSAARNRRGVR